MKKRVSKLMSFALSLVLILSLSVPALAYQDTDPPQWEQWGYSSLEEMLADGWTEEEYYEYAAILAEAQAQVQAWIDAHPNDASAFDPYDYYSTTYAPGLYTETAHEFMDYWGITEEEFRQIMLEDWAQDQMNREEWQKDLDAFAAEYPEEYAAFDPYEYFAQNFSYYGSVQEYMDTYRISEESFVQSMTAYYMEEVQAQAELDRELADFIAAYPAEYADFDPYAYFAQEYPYYDSADEYMGWYELTAEEFCQKMLLDWMRSFQYRAEEIAAVGGSTAGVNVMVKGQCIPFPDAQPEIINDRTMVPLAAAMEYLGADVSYDQATHTALVSMDAYSFTHAIGTQVLDLPDGSTFTMDTASYIKEGRTMVPVAFFAQYLGYEVYWDGDYRTAVLLDRQETVDMIDQQFTLINRMLYTMSGTGIQKEGHSLKNTLALELDLTLMDSLKGNQNYSFSITGSELTNEVASQVEYTMDLADLKDLLLNLGIDSYMDMDEQAELEQLLSMLAGLKLELILDLEGQCLYLHSPIFQELELVENPDAWAALPLNGLLDNYLVERLESSAAITIGQLLVASAFDSGSGAFCAWENLDYNLYQASLYISDGCFSKSGSSYSITWDMAELDPEFFMEEENIAIVLKITPSGDKGCRYSLTLKMTSDEMAMDAALTGSSGKLDLDLDMHIKNTAKLLLELESRITSTTLQPDQAPPAGSVIEYPAGILGSGTIDW